MASFNKVYLMGNLTRDPEVRTTPSGLKIAKFGLAVNRKYRTRDNETKEEVTFVDIDAFGQQAEILERYVEKGSPLFVEGRLRLDQWQTSTGDNRSKLTVVLENFQFIDSARGPETNRDEESSASNSSSGGSSLKEDDDVPF